MQKTIDRPWTQFYPEEIPAEMNYEIQPLHALLENAEASFPKNKAISFQGTTLTYQELGEQTRAFANELSALGVEKGDRVAIMLPNTPQSVIAYYGALMIGAVVVQTNPLYVERELEHQMADSGAKVIVCLDLLYPKVMKVKHATQLEHVIVTGIKDYLPFPKNMIYPFIQKKNQGMKVKVEYSRTVHAFKPMIKRGSTSKVQVSIDPDHDLALLQYTGGTTGLAKGVMLTHRNLVANTTQCLQWMYRLERGKEKTLAVLPFFHVYGMTVSMNLSVMSASETIILPKFDPKEVLETIQKEQISIFPGAPTMYIGLINHPDAASYDLSSVQACMSGSAALPLEVQQTFEEMTGGKLVEGYGLTEAAPVTHCNLLWGTRREGSIGLPWPDTEAGIYSEENGMLPPNEIGELVIRGPQVMQGYWKRPEETAATFYEDWLLTGDMGYMDEDGFFYIVDRKKDMIIAGGFNIYPREVEEVLYEHDDIQEAVIVGVPDEYRGETVKAFIVLKEGSEVDEAALDAFCRKNLAAYKVPRSYEFRDELPKTTVGKVLRRVLVDEAQTEEKAKSS